MANRNFRENLALICGLASGVGALSIMNVPTSAVTEEQKQKMEKDVNQLVEDFTEQYNAYRKLDEKLNWKHYKTMKTSKEPLKIALQSKICPEVAEALADIILNSRMDSTTRDKLLDVRDQLQLELREDDVLKLDMFLERLRTHDRVNWWSGGTFKNVYPERPPVYRKLVTVPELTDEQKQKMKKDVNQLVEDFKDQYNAYRKLDRKLDWKDYETTKKTSKEPLKIALQSKICPEVAEALADIILNSRMDDTTKTILGNVRTKLKEAGREQDVFKLDMLQHKLKHTDGINWWGFGKSHDYRP